MESFAPQLETYSIDESFLDLTGVCQHNPVTYAQQIKKTIHRSTGIPVCVGMGPTKTLAKLANYAAKKWKKTNGVLDLSDPVRRKKLMRLVPVNEVWGIGRQTTKRLQLMGINSVYDLAMQPVESIQAQFNIVVARTVMELNGISCLSVEDIAPAKQQIVCSRSFKLCLTEYHELAEALTSFCSRAAEKLRKQHSVAASVTVFIRTNPYSLNQPQYQRSIHCVLNQSTADTRQIIRQAKQLLKEIYKPGYRYQKCGLQLGHINPASLPDQLDLFESIDINRNQALMTTVDQINHKFPKGIAVSTAEIQQNWQYKVKRLSRHYTTNWNELATVHCL